jgi:hypothetical protein
MHILNKENPSGLVRCLCLRRDAHLEDTGQTVQIHNTQNSAADKTLRVNVWVSDDCRYRFMCTRL